MAGVEEPLVAAPAGGSVLDFDKPVPWSERWRLLRSVLVPQTLYMLGLFSFFPAFVQLALRRACVHEGQDGPGGDCHTSHVSAVGAQWTNYLVAPVNLTSLLTAAAVGASSDRLGRRLLVGA